MWDDKSVFMWYNSNMKKGQHKDLLKKQVLFALYKGGLHEKVVFTAVSAHVGQGDNFAGQSDTYSQIEDIKKRWQEYTEELCKKDLHDPDNHSGVIVSMMVEYHYKQS